MHKSTLVIPMLLAACGNGMLSPPPLDATAPDAEPPPDAPEMPTDPCAYLEISASAWSDVVSADYAMIGGAVTVVYQEDSGLPRFVVSGPTQASAVDETLPSTAATHGRLSSPEDFAVVTFQDQAGAFPLMARTWAPGTAQTDALATIFATMPAAEGVWDVHSAKTVVFGDHVTAWAAATPTATDTALHVRLGDITGTEPLVALPGSVADVAVAVWPRRVARMSGTSIRTVVVRAFQDADTWMADVRWIDFDVVTGAVASNVGSTGVLADATGQVHSVALSFLDRESVYMGIEQTFGGSRKVTYYTAQRSGGIAPSGLVHELTSLVGQGAILAGTPSDMLVSAGAAPLSPAFLEQLLGDGPAQQSGWLMFAPHTGAILSRAFVGLTGNLTTRSARPAKGSVIATGDDVTWAGPAATPGAPASDLRAVALCRLARGGFGAVSDE
jgi:hypothetical protein